MSSSPLIRRFRRRRFRPPRRFLLLPALAVALFVGVGAFQMDSAVGRAEAAGACAVHADWLQVAPPPVPTWRVDVPRLRAVTYNLRTGLGPDWRLFSTRPAVERRLRAIAADIAAAAPRQRPVDVVGLNEVDFHSRRSGWLDQAAFLAAELERLTGYSYRVVRGETWRRAVPGLEVRFGNALLTRHPLLSARSCRLGVPCADAPEPQPLLAGGGVSSLVGEARGVVTGRIDFHGRPLDVLVTHLEAVVLDQREAQAAEILRRFVDPARPTLLLGDVNAVPAAMTGARRHFAADRTHDVLTGAALLDARVTLAARRQLADLSPWATYPVAVPSWPLDAALATADLAPLAARTLDSGASDHRGLAVAFGWLGDAAAVQQGDWHARLRQVQLERIRRCDLAGPDGARREAWLTGATGYAEFL